LFLLVRKKWKVNNVNDYNFSILKKQSSRKHSEIHKSFKNYLAIANDFFCYKEYFVPFSGGSMVGQVKSSITF
jgi:hypothetical protein